MASARLQALLRHVHRLLAVPAAGESTDRQLLDRFARDHDEAAFAALVHRHAPLVLGVSRRLLRQTQDAEDVLQATFLVLARKAASLRSQESVAGWLYRVAYRLAAEVKAKTAKQRKLEREAGTMTRTEATPEGEQQELLAVLDEELHRMPEKYREPLLLCYLEGQTRDQAAQRLGWSVRTLHNRLEHGLGLLRKRLTDRGVGLPVALLTAALSQQMASAAVSSALAATVVKAAVAFAAGTSFAAGGSIAVEAAALAEGAVKGMALAKAKIGLVLLLAVGLAASGAGVVAHQVLGARQPEEKRKGRPQLAYKPAKPEPQKQQTRTDRFGDLLPEGALARMGTTRFRQGLAAYYRAVFSPDGKTVACAGVERGACLWDVATGKELLRFGRGYVYAVAFSPNGKLLASSDNDLPALFDVASGKMLGHLADARITEHGVASVSFAPDGKTVAVALYNAGIAVWEVSVNGSSRLRFEKTHLDSGCIAFSPDGKILVSAGKDKAVHIWDAATGNELGRLTGHARDVYAVAFSPDGQHLLAPAEDQSFRLWNVASRKLIRVLDGKTLVQRTNSVRIGSFERTAVAFSPDGMILATGHGDGTMVLWNAGTGEEIRRWQAHCFAPSSIDFSPDGKTLVSGACWESGPRFWDVATGEEVRPFTGHHAPVDGLTFSADGKSIRSLGRDLVLLDWHLTTGRETVCFRHPRWARDGCKISPQGDVLATWSLWDDTIRLRDAVTGKERFTFGRYTGRNDYGFDDLPMAFSPNGQALAFGAAKDHKVFVWDVVSGKQRQQWELPGVCCVAFSPDGKTIGAATREIAARASSTLGLWDATTGEKRTAFAGMDPVSNIVFSPDGAVLAASSRFGPTRLWDTETGHELRPAKSFSRAYGLAFSPDSKLLAGAGADQKVYVWEVNTGLELRCFQGHRDSVLSVAFAPDSRSLASGGRDSMVLLWDITGRVRDGRLRMVTWTPQELEEYWQDLASQEGQRAVQAIWNLVSSPAQAVALLRRIKPAKALDSDRIERLIRDLDSEDFSRRTKATEGLVEIVDLVEPALRKKLTEKPSLEVRRLVEQILTELEPSASAERLRVLRAIQVLEYSGSPEAKELLRTIAQGVAGVRLTREAKAALERLAKQPDR